MTPAPPHPLEPALTEIEIALRKEENPSENVQWAIERLNRLQEECASHSTTPSEREQVLDELNDWIHSFNFISVSSCPTIFDVLEKIAELRSQPPDTSVLSDRNWT